jgi:hypothetical protein
MMLTKQNERICMTCEENGQGLAFIDQKRKTRWELDPQSLVYGKANQNPWGNVDPEHQRLLPLQSASKGESAFTITYQAGETVLEMRFRLMDEFVEVSLPGVADSRIGHVSLPGSFIPQNERLSMLLPIMQGMLWDGRGPEMSCVRAEGSHAGFSMAFVGFLAETGGLLLTAETRDDCRWWYGKDQTGRIWAANLQIQSLGAFRDERKVRLYFTDPDIVALAKQYRKKVIEQGRFITWDEKIAARPALERLFGALMCFIGYCEDDVDYVQGAQKLKAYGFDRALMYPARFNIYHHPILMGGVPAINLSAGTVEAIKCLGYDLAPWSWLNEALDVDDVARSMYRRDRQGEPIPHWAIDEQQWYLVCYSFIEAWQKAALNGEIADQTWDHFDVLACVAPMECHALDHPKHHGRPLTRSQDRAWVRKAFLVDQAAGRIVSSENFNDAYSLEYDLGSVKAWPQYGPWPFWPVPLTMLVYHDSMIHSWWEVHSYNNPWRGRTLMLNDCFEYGGGRPKLMAALDALMGCPPDVFPFGAEYGYSGHGKETFLYKYRFEDPEVQIALCQALPVARLHRRIGKQEMVHFKILSENGTVQETAFADGTHVVANFSRDFVGSVPGVDHAIVEGIDRLAPESWQID